MLSKVSVIIPVKDEAEGLSRVITSVKKYASEVIVVDGHSTDQTFQICQRLKVRYLLDHGLGKGEAVRLGLKQSVGQIVIIMDGDGSHNIPDIPKMVRLIREDKADLVVGSRLTGGSFDLEINFFGVIRALGAQVLTALVNFRYQVNLTDIVYGFRAIRRSIIPQIRLEADGFDIDQEMVVGCLERGFRVVQIPSRENKRGWGRSKLKTLMGFKLFFKLLRRLYL